MFRITLFIITLLIASSTTASEKTTQQDEVLNVSDMPLGGDFTLYSSQGEFSLEQMRGKVVLLYFGYTKCPDVCYTSALVHK
ncbi:MAG: SCO family protein [Candidatus Thiodiazotropha sp. (ex Epidulcina cf. delphinae)]|nr:SCO family protein [Candidatus Thiodiazotropha sp. (ex Epidulcina cf. delphinae)]